MNIRTYQNLEGGVARLDIERLEQIAKVLEMPTEDLLKQEGYYFHQEFKEASSGTGYFGIENTFHNGVEKETVDKLITAKDGEINLLKEEVQLLREEVKSLKEDNKYLRDKLIN
jgi:hypothetical protein